MSEAGRVWRRPRNEDFGPRERNSTSAPTIYATLELLVDLGLAQRLDPGGGATLYDPRTDPHQHMVCRACGRIDDLNSELHSEALLHVAARSGFHGQVVEVSIHGLCAQCATSGSRRAGT